MTIFPPVWRLDDWVVAKYLEGRLLFRPLGLLVAGVVVISVGLLLSFLVTLRLNQLGAQLKALGPGPQVA